MLIRTVFIIVEGKVHNVGYRYFARSKANELEIKGWVKNTKFNIVELEAEGKPEDIAAFIDWLRIGPARAIVKNIVVSEIQNRNFSSFSIC